MKSTFWDGFIRAYASRWNALALAGVSAYGVFVSWDDGNYWWVAAFGAAFLVCATLFIVMVYTGSPKPRNRG